MQNDFAFKETFENSASLNVGSFYVENCEQSTHNLVANVLDHKRNKWDAIIATKDFHPPDHDSFDIFPPHCVQKRFKQGEEFRPLKVEIENNKKKIEQEHKGEAVVRGGAKFLPSVREALEKYNSERGIKTEVFFKAFFKHFDSFGGVSYPEKYGNVRPGLTKNCQGVKEGEHQACFNAFTGSYRFPLEEPDEIDSDPDAHSYGVIEDATDPDEAFKEKIPQRLDDRLKEIIFTQGKQGRKVVIRICGLALDFCVKDTALNLKSMCEREGFENVDVKIILDASWPAVSNYNAVHDKEIGPGLLESSEKDPRLRRLYRDQEFIAHVPMPDRQMSSLERHRLRIAARDNSQKFTGWRGGAEAGSAGATGGGAAPRMLFWDAGLMLLVTFFASLAPRFQ